MFLLKSSIGFGMFLAKFYLHSEIMKWDLN